MVFVKCSRRPKVELCYAHGKFHISSIVPKHDILWPFFDLSKFIRPSKQQFDLPTNWHSNIFNISKFYLLRFDLTKFDFVKFDLSKVIRTFPQFYLPKLPILTFDLIKLTLSRSNLPSQNFSCQVCVGRKAAKGWFKCKSQNVFWTKKKMW